MIKNMARVSRLIISTLMLISLAGCYAAMLPTIGMAVLTAPGSTMIKELKLPDYTRGPVSSDEFSVLLQQGVSRNGGKVYLSGPVEIWGLTKKNTRFYFHAIGALSDTDFLVLGWHEHEKRYKKLMQLPYSGLLSVSTKGSRRSTTVLLCLGSKELMLGEQYYGIDLKLRIDFLKPQRLWAIDKEKNRAAIAILQERIVPQDGACQPPPTVDVGDEFLG